MNAPAKNKNSPNANDSTPLRPVVKWAGGKRQLLGKLRHFMPRGYKDYYEPFLGGGAFWLDLQPARYRVNDINPEMVNLYHVIRDNVGALIKELKTYKNDPDFFYALREKDRAPAYARMGGVKRAARILYLNKTCYNGLFRVNSKGHFNVPFGKYANPDIVGEENLKAVSAYLNRSEGEISLGDYAQCVKGAGKGSFVYFDPPYDPVSSSASFTSYTQDGFGRADQIRLKETCDALHRRGAKFMLSNAATPFILDLYAGYDINIVKASRAINSNAGGRGRVDEVLVRNYGEGDGGA
ncbi:MAG: DNA adenine methylase [Micavibrio sp.]